MQEEIQAEDLGGAVKEIRNDRRNGRENTVFGS